MILPQSQSRTTPPILTALSGQSTTKISAIHTLRQIDSQMDRTLARRTQNGSNLKGELATLGSGNETRTGPFRRSSATCKCPQRNITIQLNDLSCIHGHMVARSVFSLLLVRDHISLGCLEGRRKKKRQGPRRAIPNPRFPTPRPDRGEVRTSIGRRFLNEGL